MRNRLVFCFLSLLLAASARADWITVGPIQGFVRYPSGAAASGVLVTVCETAQNLCESTTTDFAGFYLIEGIGTQDWASIRLFAFINPAPPPLNGEYGSRTVPYDVQPASPGAYRIDVTLYPSPYQPTLIFPTNGTDNVPTSNVVLRWNDGLDAERRVYSHAYDIYASGLGIPPTLYAANVPCNGSTQCAFNVPQALEPSMVFDWYVVVKLQVPVPSGLPFTNRTLQARFNTVGTASTKYSFRTYYGYWLTADGGGGSTFSARGTSDGAFQRVTFIDNDGGQLEHDDAVHIRVSNGKFVGVDLGGPGPLDANRTFLDSSTIFRLVKLGGLMPYSSRIVAGDQVAIVCSQQFFTAAEGGGGGIVNCNRTQALQWETFTIYSHVN